MVISCAVDHYLIIIFIISSGTVLEIFIDIMYNIHV